MCTKGDTVQELDLADFDQAADFDVDSIFHF